jgi:hypothetical protein
MLRIFICTCIVTFEANGDVNVKLIKFENEEEIETLQLNGR